MFQVFFIILATAAIALFEAPSLISLKLKKELYVFFCLLFMAAGFGIMQGLRIEIPNPFEIIAIVLDPVTNLMLKLLE
jgi:hypothetical protein